MRSCVAKLLQLYECTIKKLLIDAKYTLAIKYSKLAIECYTLAIE